MKEGGPGCSKLRLSVAHASCVLRVPLYGPGSAEVQRLAQGPANGPQLGRQLRARFMLVVGLGPSVLGPQTGVNLFSRPELKQDHPLNLSISISGGKETNKDSPSNGE